MRKIPNLKKKKNIIIIIINNNNNKYLRRLTTLGVAQACNLRIWE
jgi:Fe2+ transport system protein FeoA